MSYVCKYCNLKEKEEGGDFVFKVSVGLDVRSIEDIKITKLCTSCLKHILAILNITKIKDTEHFKGLDYENLFTNLKVKDSKHNFVIALEPIVSENYQVFSIDKKQLEYISNLLCLNEQTSITNIRELLF